MIKIVTMPVLVSSKEFWTLMLTNTLYREYRDQGLTRPKVLIVLPFRDSALKVVNIMMQLLMSSDQVYSCWLIFKCLASCICLSVFRQEKKSFPFWMELVGVCSYWSQMSSIRQFDMQLRLISSVQIFIYLFFTWSKFRIILQLFNCVLSTS